MRNAVDRSLVNCCYQRFRRITMNIVIGMLYQRLESNVFVTVLFYRNFYEHWFFEFFGWLVNQFRKNK